MNVEMRENKHLCITFNPQKGDRRQVIIDEEHKDIRICDGHHVVKLRWEGNKLKDILVDDVFVHHART